MQEVLLPQGPIRYREYGQGEPIVLVHGLLTDGRLWQDVAPLLGRRSPRYRARLAARLARGCR